MLGGLTQLVTLRAAAWEEGAGPALPASLRHLELLDMDLGRGGEELNHPLNELNEVLQVPRCIQRVLPAGTKLKVIFNLGYAHRLREWGSLQALLARLGAQLRSWAGLQEAVGCRLELSMELSGCAYQTGDGDMEAGLDRLLPALIEALAPVAASIHTLKLLFGRHQLGAAMSASLARTLPSLRELHVYRCHLHDSVVAPLAQLRQLHLEAPLCADEVDWGQLAAALAALLADRGQVLEGGGGEGVHGSWRGQGEEAAGGGGGGECGRPSLPLHAQPGAVLVE